MRAAACLLLLAVADGDNQCAAPSPLMQHPHNESHQNSLPPLPPPPPLPSWLNRSTTLIALLRRHALLPISNVTAHVAASAAHVYSNRVLPTTTRYGHVVTQRSHAAVRKSGERLRSVATDASEALETSFHRLADRLVEARRRLWRRDRAVSRILQHASVGQWYRVLCVKRKASQRELKSAYRKLAKRAHPDKTRDERAAAAFDALRDAYDLLLDERKRARHDEELARQDERARQQRARHRAAAGRLALGVLRTTLRATRRMVAFGWHHKRWTAAGLGVVGLRLLVADSISARTGPLRL